MLTLGPLAKVPEHTWPAAVHLGPSDPESCPRKILAQFGVGCSPPKVHPAVHGPRPTVCECTLFLQTISSVLIYISLLHNKNQVNYDTIIVLHFHRSVELASYMEL